VNVKASALVADLVTEFKTNGRIVIVGACLAGLRAAEALRDEGFNGNLTIIGDEKEEPYDRPPRSKMVLKGWVRADHTHARTGRRACPRHGRSGTHTQDGLPVGARAGPPDHCRPQ
jgi:NADPH-dependent 2,4-dienoyl-CoA reductase/sulfur reductase-like enzyme